MKPGAAGASASPVPGEPFSDCSVFIGTAGTAENPTRCSRLWSPRSTRRGVGRRCRREARTNLPSFGFKARRKGRARHSRGRPARLRDTVRRRRRPSAETHGDRGRDRHCEGIGGPGRGRAHAWSDARRGWRGGRGLGAGAPRPSGRAMTERRTKRRAPYRGRGWGRWRVDADPRSRRPIAAYALAVQDVPGVERVIRQDIAVVGSSLLPMPNDAHGFCGNCAPCHAATIHTVEPSIR